MEVAKYLIEHFKVLDAEVKLKVTLDGRPNGQRGELSVGLVPFLGTAKQQSSKNVFPIAISQGIYPHVVQVKHFKVLNGKKEMTTMQPAGHT